MAISLEAVSSTSCCFGHVRKAVFPPFDAKTADDAGDIPKCLPANIHWSLHPIQDHPPRHVPPAKSEMGHKMWHQLVRGRGGAIGDVNETPS